MAEVQVLRLSSKLKGKNKFLVTALLVALGLLLLYFIFRSLDIPPKPKPTCSPPTSKNKGPPLNSTTVRIILNHSIPAFQMDIADVEEHLSELKADDPRLIHYTRIRHLTPPSKLPYNLKNSSSGDNPERIMKWVVNFFKNKRDGIFIEARGHEGERGSNSLYLEKKLGWTGLLVECHPKLVPILKMKHRKAWVADVCLAVKKHAEVKNFTIASGRLSAPPVKERRNPDPKPSLVDVQTIPLYTLLAAIGWKDVDFFSLDIEGQELDVLKQFPFDKVRFQVLVIELVLWSYTYEARLKELKEFMKGKGYWFVKVDDRDLYFVHKHLPRMKNH